MLIELNSDAFVQIIDLKTKILSQPLSALSHVHIFIFIIITNYTKCKLFTINLIIFFLQKSIGLFASSRKYILTSDQTYANADTVIPQRGPIEWPEIFFQVAVHDDGRGVELKRVRTGNAQYHHEYHELC